MNLSTHICHWPRCRLASKMVQVSHYYFLITYVNKLKVFYSNNHKFGYWFCLFSHISQNCTWTLVVTKWLRLLSKVPKFYGFFQSVINVLLKLLPCNVEDLQWIWTFVPSWGWNSRVAWTQPGKNKCIKKQALNFFFSFFHLRYFVCQHCQPFVFQCHWWDATTLSLGACETHYEAILKMSTVAW